MEGYLMERDAPREPFGFAIYFISLTRSLTTLNCWVVTVLKLMLYIS